MRSFLSDFNKQSQADAVDKAAALVGVNNGRNHVVLERVDTDLIRASSDKNKKSDLVDYILTQNLDYAEVFEHTMGQLRDAEAVVDQALLAATARYEDSQAKLDTIADRMAELDGTKVSRDKDGNVWTIDGVLVDPERAEAIEWTGREPSTSEVNAAVNQANADFSTLTRIRLDEVRLGEIRSEMQTEPDIERVGELGDEIEAIKERNEQLLSRIDNTHSHSTDVRQEQSFVNTSVPSI